MLLTLLCRMALPISQHTLCVVPLPGGWRRRRRRAGRCRTPIDTERKMPRGPSKGEGAEGSVFGALFRTKFRSQTNPRSQLMSSHRRLHRRRKTLWEIGGLCGKADSQDAAGVPMEGTTRGLPCRRYGSASGAVVVRQKKGQWQARTPSGQVASPRGLHYDCIQVLSAGRPASRFVVQKAAASTVQFAFPRRSAASSEHRCRSCRHPPRAPQQNTACRVRVSSTRALRH